MPDSDVIQLPLPDRSAREQISRDLDTNLLVEAGAGSGKTTAMVDRMVALIQTGVAEVGHIAAVTFTRKAAGELRERFQARLEERLVAARTAGDDDASLRLLDAIDEIDRAFIGTIHSFCGRLLKERPLEIGLDPGFQELAVEERVRVRRRFWDSHLERLARDSDPVMEELVSAGLRPTALFGLFEQVVENPDVDFVATAVEAPTPAATHPVRIELSELVDAGWELMGQEPAKGWDSLQKKIRTLHFTRDVTGWEKQPELFDALAAICKPGPNGHRPTLNRWKQPDMVKPFTARVNAFSVGSGSPGGQALEQWHAHRYALAVRLAVHAADEFTAYRLRVGRLDFQDLLLFTAQLLRSRRDVRRQFGSRYRRLLVDEFQDTDPLQAEIMLLLASDPVGEPPAEPDAEALGLAESLDDWRTAVPRPGALFVVGDPKQSIYRFRRADIQLYAFVKARFADFGEVLELTSNFRSRPPIGDLVNQVFRSESFFPAEATPEQAAFEPLNTRPGTVPSVREGVFLYEFAPEGRSKAEAGEMDAALIASLIRGRVEAGEREPGEFLVLTRRRSNLDAYARALEEQGLPVQVTGAGIGVEEELHELQVLLGCMIDPANPVKVVAVLVGLFFGLDYERLVSHRLAGGSFDVIRVRGDGDPDVVEALRLLHQWWRASTRAPADVFVSGLARTLGLVPFAAAGTLGSVRAGAMVYALDAIRASVLAGEASLPGAVAALEEALRLNEVEAPLEPGRSDVVRVMNLHQAKGLESEVVILAGPSANRDRAPDLHVHRTEDGRAEGFVSVTATSAFGTGTRLAAPTGWGEMEETERRFAEAEEVRLLYVAVTRAKEELIIARLSAKPEVSPWAMLNPWVDDRAERLEIELLEPRPRARLDEAFARDAQVLTEEARTRLRHAARPGFAHATVTEIAKKQDTYGQAGGTIESGAPEEALRGYSWGSVVHGALAYAAEDPTPEGLRFACRDLLIDFDRPLDDHGEPLELPELLDLVAAVRASEVWTRALEAVAMLVEAPFAVSLPDLEEDDRRPEESPSTEAHLPTSRGKRQLDLFAGVSVTESDARVVDAPPADTPPTVLEGVVDLVFREAEGWVIVDYKTDVGTDPTFSERERAYRRQVDLYAQAWAALTGDPIKERMLFFTAQGRVERW